MLWAFIFILPSLQSFHDRIRISLAFSGERVVIDSAVATGGTQLEHPSLEELEQVRCVAGRDRNGFATGHLKLKQTLLPLGREQILFRIVIRSVADHGGRCGRKIVLYDQYVQCMMAYEITFWCQRRSVRSGAGSICVIPCHGLK